jgi:hypothetical protein
MRSHPARRKLFAAAPTAFHPRPRWAATFNFRALPSMVGMVGALVGAACGSLRAHGEVRAHIAPCKLGTATPAAFHPRSSWVPDEIECRVLLELPYTNPTPTPATSLRHTMTAERQRGVVVLRSVNVLAAAQTDRHASGASRTATSSNSPCLDEDFFNYSILRLVWNGSPHFPRAGVPQDQSLGASEGHGCGRLGVLGRLRRPSGSPRLTFRVPPSAVPVLGACRPLRHTASASGSP